MSHKKRKPSTCSIDLFNYNIAPTQREVKENICTTSVAKEPNSMYFSAEEEKAIVDYLNAEDSMVREKIFSKILYPAFLKMGECIIRRYSLFIPNEDFFDTLNDVISYLVTRLHRFDPSKNTKAYSFCGTVCKNYLILRKQARLNQIKKEYSIQTFSLGNDNDDMYESHIAQSKNAEDLLKKTTNNDFEPIIIDEKEEDFTEKEEQITIGSQLIKNTSDKLRRSLEEDVYKEKDLLIGNGILDLLKNWENVYEDIGDNKFNKTMALYYISEYTMLPVSEVRKGIKQFKKKYKKLKEDFLKQEL